MQAVKSFVFSLSLVFAFTFFCRGQIAQQQPSLAMVLLDMAAHNRYESSTIGFAALKSKQYERFEQMMAIATEEQLVDLATNHKNAVVRVYALQALKYKKVAIPNSLAEQFRNDNTIINVFRGCVMDKKPVSHVVKESVINRLASPGAGIAQLRAIK